MTDDNIVFEVDADSIPYIVGYISDKKKLTLYQAFKLLDDYIANMFEDSLSDVMMLYLGGTTNYRTDVDPEYKANRKDKSKPLYYHALRQRMIQKHGAIVIEGQEAEDFVGIQAQLHRFQETSYCIGAIDKDMNMIPGQHYNYQTQFFCNICPVKALQNFYLQMVTGDATDNIPSLYHYVKEYDEKAANKLKRTYKRDTVEKLSVCTDEMRMYDVVYNLYEKCLSGHMALDEVEHLLEKQGQLLWIRRFPDEMWELPTTGRESYLPTLTNEDLLDD